MVKKHLTTVQDVADIIGRTKLARGIGVTPSAVSNSLAKGYFPAAWFVAVDMMLSYQGYTCDRSIFYVRKINKMDD